MFGQVAILGASVLLVLWSIPSIRVELLNCLPRRAADRLEDWGLAALGVLLAALSLWVGASCYVGQTPCPPAIAASDQVVRGRVVSATWQRGVKTRVPAVGATVTVGERHATTNEQGTFELHLPQAPLARTIVDVSHPAHRTRFVRWDDPSLREGGEIELTKRIRLVVLDAQRTASTLRGTDERHVVRARIEEDLRALDIELLADDEIATDILQRLQRYKRGSAIFDPETIQRVGDFQGVSHGVFWSAVRGGGHVQVELRLVNFGTTRIEASLTAHVRSEKWPEGVGGMASELLAQLTEVQILSPKSGTDTTHALTVEGYAHLLPPSWRIWITLLPEGNSLHFPQLEVTVHDNGMWVAPAVYVGPEHLVGSELHFRVYAILVDSEYSDQVRSYLRSQSGVGISIGSWDARRCRVLGYVEVTRRS